MRIRKAFLISCLGLVLGLPCLAQEVSIRVDASKSLGELKPIHSYFGYDEPNYTYMKDGRKLLTELSELSPVPVYVRAHNLLTTGDGKAALKWGSTNAYTEDAQGNPVYDWTIVDRIFDTYVERGMKPLVEIGFMPEALSVKPQPYRHEWGPEQQYANIFTGWAHPPRDYEKWAELVYQWVLHCVERYGREEVESWYWEPWNEPNIAYWQGTPEEYHKLYDYSVDAVRRAAPGAIVGGPHSTGPGSERAAKFLRDFLEHVVNGKNYVTGKKGSPIDFVAFHAKGRPQVVDNHVQMGSQFHLRSIDRGFEIVASFPSLKPLPIIIGESDPEGCAACSVRFHPQNGYRNGTMYSSYTAAVFARKYELARKHGVNLEGALTWAFEFENQPYFAGFRSLATGGIDKPVLNVFRMFSQMHGQQVAAESSGQKPLEDIMRDGVRGEPDVGVMASRDKQNLYAMVWHYHDDDLPGPEAEVRLQITGWEYAPGQVTHYRIDEEHSNSFTAWKEMGSPQEPTDEQYAELEEKMKLTEMNAPGEIAVDGNKLEVKFSLPRAAVSLLVFTM